MLYDFFKQKKVFSSPLNWSMDVTFLMLWGSLFHILGPIDENEELWAIIVLHLLTGISPFVLECNSLPCHFITRLAKYFGAVDDTHLYIKTATLKKKCSFTFSQCMSAITDETKSNFLGSHINLQNMFCSCWSLFKWCFGIPRRRLLQYPELMIVWEFLSHLLLMIAWPLLFF